MGITQISVEAYQCDLCEICEPTGPRMSDGWRTSDKVFVCPECDALKGALKESCSTVLGGLAVDPNKVVKAVRKAGWSPPFRKPTPEEQASFKGIAETMMGKVKLWAKRQ